MMVLWDRKGGEMFKRITIAGYRIVAGVFRITRVVGINSRLRDGRHMLMWDFDGSDLEVIKHDLWMMQKIFALPVIRIYRSRPAGGYHAYCFQPHDFYTAALLILLTDGVDRDFWRWGVVRRYWTLRIGPGRGGYIPELASVLESEVPSGCSYHDLVDYSIYETKVARGRGHGDG